MSRSRSTPVLTALATRIVQAPMAGGPSTPELAAAVARAGGLGFLAAGYLTGEQLVAQLSALMGLSDAPFGVNVFVGGVPSAELGAVVRYADLLRGEAARAGIELGEPRFDDDGFEAKIALLLQRPPAVVSFAFGAPPRPVVEALHAAGCEVWLTVTSVAEAAVAAAVGADAVVVQGVEAGGHRGVFVDDDTQSSLGLLVALELIAAAVPLPLVAAGGLMTGAAIAGVLAAGAAAAQLGTAYLLAEEAGTAPAHRAAVAGDGRTVLTRAFSGRTARGIENRWHREYGALAPVAYPEVHHLTSPLRAHGRRVGDPDLINLWAGEGHSLAVASGAEEITLRLAGETRAALGDAIARLSGDSTWRLPA